MEPLGPLPMPPCTGQVRHQSASVRTTASQRGHSCTIRGLAAALLAPIFFYICLWAWVLPSPALACRTSAHDKVT
jgi:hypothetical protein